jgi:dienelactone hydrolase
VTTPHRRGQNTWIETDSGFVSAVWYWPQGAAASTAVVIVPGIAHEERTMGAGLIALAESLADAGLPTLLMELHGCSQSAGRLDDADIGACWSTGIRAAVRHARDSGAARVIVIGLRLGVPLAVEALAEEALAALIAWAPIVNGKRYVRELKLLQRTADPEVVAAGAIAIGGFSIPSAALKHIAALDLTKIETLNTSCVMLRETLDGLNAPWLTRLSQRGVMVQEQVSTQIHSWLFSGADQPDLPHEDIQGLTRWCRVLHDEQATTDETAPRRLTQRAAIEFVHNGRPVRETFLEIGPNGLTALLAEPVDGASGHAVRLMMSTVGPGRTFADFARDEASRGNSSLRFDFTGFGTSGHGEAMNGGELYTDGGAQDVQAVIVYLRQTGYRRIYGLGFCAGAWSMMQAGGAPEFCAAVAINVQLYRQPGLAMPEFMTRTRQRLARISPALVRNSLLRGVAARMRRPARERREPIEWLIRLCSSDVRVLLAYADLDLGLDYLNGQMSNGVREQLRRPFTLQIYPDLGHLAEGTSARTRMFRDIADFFAELDREALGSHEPWIEPPVSAVGN